MALRLFIELLGMLCKILSKCCSQQAQTLMRKTSSLLRLFTMRLMLVVLPSFRCFIDAGANINARNIKGQTPLSIAEGTRVFGLGKDPSYAF